MIQIDRLDELKNQFTSDSARRILRLLEQLSRKKISDTDSLIRYHEILLFLRAYPQNSSIVRATENELRAFAARVSALEDSSALQHPEVSGVAGTSVTDTFSFYIVRWLLQRHAKEVAMDW